MTNLAQNRKAGHDYFVLEKFEAGIALQGTEVKSCRKHDISMADAYAEAKAGELWLIGVHIAPYSHGNRQNHDPRRSRRLLLHKKEIRKITEAIEAKGMTVIPLSFFLSRGKVKVELGLCKGKREYDKRESLKKKMHNDEMKRAMSAKNR